MEGLFSSEPEEEVFGNIVELIVTLSETREDVQKILNDLLATDWDVMLAHNLHYSQKAHEAYFHDWYCACCFEHGVCGAMEQKSVLGKRGIKCKEKEASSAPACERNLRAETPSVFALLALSTASS